MSDSETNETHDRHLSTPITEAVFVMKMATSVVSDNKFGASNRQYILDKFKEMEVKIQNGEIIDGDLLIEQLHKESKKPKSERSSENISLMLPFVYAVQAVKIYNPENKDSVSLAWSLIADAKYHLGFMSAATLMTELAIEREKRATDEAIELTKGLSENLDGMMATTDNILEIDRIFTKVINRANAIKEKRDANRHAENRAMEDEVIQYYEKNKDTFTSISTKKVAAAIINAKLNNLVFTTVRDHISKHRKKNKHTPS